MGDIFYVVLVSLIAMTENLTKQFKEGSIGAHSLRVRTTSAGKFKWWEHKHTWIALCPQLGRTDMDAGPLLDCFSF